MTKEDLERFLSRSTTLFAVKRDGARVVEAIGIETWQSDLFKHGLVVIYGCEQETD